ncbi:MAG TPA: LytTR family DNA-binding domain-containing protein [Ruminiclostridium sp.]|nr:LytTR family DNA-binding domain-containing protein [Ruminiclostridium sp.]
MNLKIAVCDDMQEDCEVLAKCISQYADEKMLDIEIKIFNSGVKLISDFLAEDFKIVFLDIYMNGLSGIETAYKIRDINKDCMIIFTTTSPDFRAEGFEVGATHYLLKPLTYSGVEEALRRCSHFLSDGCKFINVTVDRHTVPVRLQDILYAEVYGKAVSIHTMNGVLKTYLTLAKLEAALTGTFLKCDRSYIVNMQYITGMEKESFLLVNGEKVPIRFNGRQKVKDSYNRYLLKSIRGGDYV